MSLVALTYASTAAPDLDDATLAQIAERSARNNAGLGITSVLLHAADTFLHLLEGEERAVLKTFNRIDADARHRGITVVDWRFLVDRSPDLEGLSYVRFDADTVDPLFRPRLARGFDASWISTRPDVLRAVFARHAPGTARSFPGFGGR